MRANNAVAADLDARADHRVGADAAAAADADALPEDHARFKDHGVILGRLARVDGGQGDGPMERQRGARPGSLRLIGPDYGGADRDGFDGRQRDDDTAGLGLAEHGGEFAIAQKGDVAALGRSQRGDGEDPAISAPLDCTPDPF